MESSLNSRGQITIPKAAREHLKVRPGDRVKLFLHPNGSVVIAPKLLPVSAIKGMFAGRVKRPVSVEEMDAAVEHGAGEDETTRNRSIAAVNTRFLKSGIRIQNAFGSLVD